MPRLTRGLYESLITEELRDLLDRLGAPERVTVAPLRPADAADRIALHLGRLIRRTLTDSPEEERVERGIDLVARVLASLEAGLAGWEGSGEKLTLPAKVLRAILDIRPDGSLETLEDPLTPLLDTTLLTNAPGEPRVGQQLVSEIQSADSVDMVMAFIRHSGIRPMLEALQAHGHRGKPLRVLTTIYTGTTEARALDSLAAIGADVRVSYDASTTRLHAKAWLFHRHSGFSTAYIGSSNLTHSAQVTGMEWNLRLSGARNPDVIEKIQAVFESYWSSGDFVPYDRDHFLQRIGAERGPGRQLILSPIELRPEPFQDRLLEQIALARTRGHHRNLLVAATGVGKTVMAAIDYARLRETLPRSRLLFVAHREEILDQSLMTFRHALRDPSFGERWVGGERPTRFDHVFASIQSLWSSGLDHLPADHFDVVIVDEFHHAAAPSYKHLLDHVNPKELLGLTATPERADGLPILDWFDGRIAAELRLWDAIDQHRLSPFVYYGVHDGTDLSEIPWRRGRGYDVERLSNLYTSDRAWARRVLKQLAEKVGSLEGMRALGFCVSVNHAQFMARCFQEAGIPAEAVWADTDATQRKEALTRLRRRETRALFSVDLFNEGVDVPVVDTLMLLRPTDSGTLFLQQLGRGLRLSPDKAQCTVLDFVGHHRKEFRYDRRLRALLGGTRKSLMEQVESGFPYLPAGCHMELDRVASQIVLRSLRESLPTQWKAKIEALREMSRGGNRVSLSTYLEETGLEPEDLYTADHSWSELLADSGVTVHPPGPSEQILRRAIGRLLHLDDSLRIEEFRRMLRETRPPDISTLTERERRLVRMLVATLIDKAVNRKTSLEEGLLMLWEHPQVLSELVELLDVLEARIDHLHPELTTHPEVPLRIHARYSRLEICAAFGIGEGAKVMAWQTGVMYADDARSDLLAFTLDKTEGHFSPTTRYRDYAISRELIHWESQSVVREASGTGLRYQRHRGMGSHIMLFARLSSADRAFWFLGPADYVRHESERPMAITWKLHHSLPGDLFASFAAAVA